jgi:hypothetical protein
MRVQQYSESGKTLWDGFVRDSKNGTFVLLRDYMEYHRDRFQDHSLFVWDERRNLVAVLPANEDENVLVSHGGLTYGGFVTDKRMKTPDMLGAFEAVLLHLQQESFRKLVYKTIPHIYHRFPAEEDRYALFLCNASLIRRGVLAVIDSNARLPFRERRDRGIKKARRNGLTVGQCDDFESYWEILSDRLLKAHGALPVHSLPEMELLREKFPRNIKLFACFQGSRMLGGVVIYESEKVARAQYIAASDEGQELGALDLVFSELLTHYYSSKPFFDFGTSDEKNGRYLNRGLIDQKEGFGARAVVHDHYEIDLDDWKPRSLVEAMK